MKRYGDFSIGDLARLINTKLVGIIIGEERETERYRVEWINTIWGQPDASWVSYDRLERI
jgi:hypothetical protein